MFCFLYFFGFKASCDQKQSLFDELYDLSNCYDSASGFIKLKTLVRLRQMKIALNAAMTEDRLSNFKSYESFCSKDERGNLKRIGKSMLIC